MTATKPPIAETTNAELADPSRLFVVSTLLQSWIMAAIAGIGIGFGIARSWDPCAWIGSFILILAPVMFFIFCFQVILQKRWQYAQFFALLQIVLALVPTPLILAAIAIVPSEGLTAQNWPLLAIPAVGMAIFLPTIIMSFRHYRRCARAGLAPTTDSRKGFTLKELLLLVVLLSSAIGTAVASFQGTPPKFARNVGPAEAPLSLPENATEVCYFQGPRGIIWAEFTIDEQGFKDWVESEVETSNSHGTEIGLEPIIVPISVTRYEYLVGEMEQDDAYVNSGWHYSWTFADEGVHAVYDSKTNRAYFYRHGF